MTNPVYFDYHFEDEKPDSKYQFVITNSFLEKINESKASLKEKLALNDSNVQNKLQLVLLFFEKQLINTIKTHVLNYSFSLLDYHLSNYDNESEFINYLNWIANLEPLSYKPIHLEDGTLIYKPYFNRFNKTVDQNILNIISKWVDYRNKVQSKKSPKSKSELHKLSKEEVIKDFDILLNKEDDKGSQSIIKRLRKERYLSKNLEWITKDDKDLARLYHAIVRVRFSGKYHLSASNAHAYFTNHFNRAVNEHYFYPNQKDKIRNNDSQTFESIINAKIKWS